MLFNNLDTIGHSEACHPIQDHALERQLFELIINLASLQPIAEARSAFVFARCLIFSPLRAGMAALAPRLLSVWKLRYQMCPDISLEPEKNAPQVISPPNQQLLILPERRIDLVAVNLPEASRLNFNLDMDPGFAYACMAETMILALERRFEDTGLGIDPDMNDVAEMSRLAERHEVRPASIHSSYKSAQRLSMAKAA